jgi:hypothetical protein
MERLGRDGNFLVVVKNKEVVDVITNVPWGRQ